MTTILLRTERLCLMTDIHKAKRRHAPVRGLRARLRVVTEALLAMEGRHGEA